MHVLPSGIELCALSRFCIIRDSRVEDVAVVGVLWESDVCTPKVAILVQGVSIAGEGGRFLQRVS